MKNPIKKLSLLALLASMLFAGSAHAACNADPVVFIHGYSGWKSQFDTMINRFRNDGTPACALYKFGYNSLFKSNKTSARELKSFVNNIRPNHNYRKAKIIAHSNGGLVSRWYRVFEGGYSATSRLVTLGTPHKGTSWAYACFSPACFEMRYNSSFLQSLAGRGCDVSLWSALDEIVIPQTNAKCGYSLRTSSVGHLTLMVWGGVYNDVRRFL
ncbi:esterase/lipase family protein [Marinobacter sp.]|uniref:esterase/lipase family protein n=1 Tax=Marinobacter sp. TaxID=50741 RepID=UPI00384FA13A